MGGAGRSGRYFRRADWLGPSHNRHRAPRNPNVGRLVGIWSAVEGVAIFVAANVCMNIGAQDEVAPVIAILVGLHFLPLARGIPLPLYYATGTALVALGLAALLLPGPERVGVTGLGAAAILWVSCVLLIRQAQAWRAA